MADGRDVAPELVVVAERLARERRALTKAFGPNADLFGDPAFDLLLQLYLQHVAGEPLDIESSAGGLSRTWRWADRLEDRGLATRDGSGTVRFRLTSRAVSLMETYLDQLRTM